MKKLLIGCFLITTTLFCFSQEKQMIKGHVFELINKDSISPLPGVNVYYSGTSQGTITDINGLFNLVNDEKLKQLVFSFSGFKSDTIEINSKKDINLILSEGKILDEFEVVFKQGNYSFSRVDPRDAQLITQGELRKAACCNLAESFEELSECLYNPLCPILIGQ